MSHSPKKPVPVSQESIKAGHEVTDVVVRPTIIFGIVLTIVVVFVYLGIWVLETQLTAYNKSLSPETSPLSDLREAPPGPSFEDTPGVQLDGYLKEQTARIETTGWDEFGPKISIELAKNEVLSELKYRKSDGSVPVDAVEPAASAASATPVAEPAVAAETPAPTAEAETVETPDPAAPAEASAPEVAAEPAVETPSAQEAPESESKAEPAAE